MRTAVRGAPSRRSPTAFLMSGTLHTLALGWVALGPALRIPPPPPSLYDSEIRPNEKRLVWYDLRERLPDVRPAEARQAAKPPRARIQLDQTLVAGARGERPAPADDLDAGARD